MTAPGNAKTSVIRLRRYIIAQLILWTLMVFSVMLWNLRDQKNHMVEQARLEAEEAFKKDVVYRLWNASKGGVYVPVSKDTPPNPYLTNVEERDITTPSGRRLTLVNPAYMTRQVHELGAREFGQMGHITSLNPIRPENAPDPWEAAALKKFENGVQEVSSVEGISGKEYLRLIRPLITEQACLKCHEAQGYKLGQVRGGISISVPMAPMSAITRSGMISTAAGNLFIWLLGLFGIAVQSTRLKNRIDERDKAEKALRESEEFHRITLGSISDAVFITDDNGRFTFICPNVDFTFGYSSEEVEQMGTIGKLLGDRFYDPAELEAHGEIRNIERDIKDKNGIEHTLLVNVKKVSIRGGTALVSCREITERKRVEKTLAFLAKHKPASGEDFFQSLAVFLADIMGMDYVCIDRLEGEGLNATTEAVYFKGRFEDNVTYALKDTPCGRVVEDGVCCFSSGVRHLFPKDEVLQDMKAESYVGTILNSYEGHPIGLIAVIGLHPLVNRQMAESILRLVAGRAAGELERKKADEMLWERATQLNNAQQMAHLGSWELDLERNRLAWSDEVFRIFGLQPQAFEATYEAFLEHVHPEDREAVDHAYSGSLSRGADFYEIEHRIVRSSDGEIRFVKEKCEHIKDDSGRIIKSAGMVHDITEQKLAQKAMAAALSKARKEQSNLQAVFDSVPVGMLLLDSDTSIRRINNMALRMAPEGTENILGNQPGNVLACIHSNEDPGGCGHAPICKLCPLRNSIGSVFASGEPVHNRELEVTFRRNGGSVSRWLSISAEPVVIDDQKHVVMAFADITEHKLAENSVKAAHAELNQVFNTAADGMRIIDLEYNVLRFNETFLEMAGLAEDEAAGSKCYDNIKGSLCDSSLCPVHGIAGGNKRIEMEVEKERRDGKRISCIMTATPFHGPDGELIGIVEDLKDITEFNRLTRIVETIRAGILQLDRQNRVIYRNRRFLEMFSLPDVREFSGDLHKHLPAPDADEILSDLEILVSGREIARPARRLSVEGRYLESSALALWGERGDYQGALLIIRDITQELLNQQTVVQQEKMASINILVAGIAHDLNNPLDGLINCIRRIKENPDNRKQTVDYLNLMTGAIGRMSGIVRQLMRFARKEVMEFRPVDLSEIISDAAHFASKGADRPEIKLSVDIKDKELFWVNGDTTALFNVFLNIMLNAYAAIEGEGEINVCASMGGGETRIEISDTGSGIPPDVLSKVFDPFFTTKKPGSGTGLGLSISKQVVSQHNGNITIRNGAPKGAVVSISIPAIGQG